MRAREPFIDKEGASGRAIVAHHLRLFGWPDAGLDNDADRRLQLLAAPGAERAADARSFTHEGGLAVAMQPDDGFCRQFSLGRRGVTPSAPSILRTVGKPDAAWTRLRTLHGYTVFDGEGLVPIVDDGSARQVWAWLPVGRGGILFIGTDLAGDIVRYRQGDPSRVIHSAPQSTWGFAHERPVYLYDEQLKGESESSRPADNWAMALAHLVSEQLHQDLLPLLPGNAPGAIVITGDDDQAYLERYEDQLTLLGETPITYFLHPLTRHRPDTLERMLRRPWVDLGLHPDALETPDDYAVVLARQANWFRGLVGQAAQSVRNHGFLNKGYWEHVEPWLQEGLTLSSNLPGLDGRVLNGSLLPARVALHGRLTHHWSVLTAIGDGVVFLREMDDAQSARVVDTLVENIRTSGIPGVVVLNLHPQNVDRTVGMHRAAIAAIERGFVAWTMRECLEWFRSRDSAIGGEGGK